MRQRIETASGKSVWTKDGESVRVEPAGVLSVTDEHGIVTMLLSPTFWQRVTEVED